MRKERKRLPLSQLELNTGQLGWLPRNPRQWKQIDIDRTKKSITEDPDFLEDRPVLVVPADKAGRFVVFAHNLCTHSAKELAWKDIPAVIYYPESDDDHLTIKRRAIKDNGSYGSNDYDALANEWDDMPLADWGLTGWEREGSASSGAEEDDFDEETDHIAVVCKPGDVWQLGDHRLMCGDSIDLEQVKTLMGGGLADISFFSPPYNTGGIGKNLTKDNGRSKYQHSDDDMAFDEYQHLLDATLQNGLASSAFVFVNLQLLANNKANVIKFQQDHIDRLADIVIWDKGRSQPQLAVNVLNNEFEFVFVFSEKATRAIGTLPFHGTLKNIVHIMPGHNDYSKLHNAVFPVEFAAHFIEHFAKDSVLDLFGGSGTTLIAAEQLGRKCYMMELDPHYCDVIIARWEKLTGKKAVKVAAA